MIIVHFNLSYSLRVMDFFFFFFNHQKLIHHYAAKGSTRLQSLLFIATIVIQNMKQYAGPLTPNLRWRTGSPDEFLQEVRWKHIAGDWCQCKGPREHALWLLPRWKMVRSAECVSHLPERNDRQGALAFSHQGVWTKFSQNEEWSPKILFRVCLRKGVSRTPCLSHSMLSIVYVVNWELNFPPILPCNILCLLQIPPLWTLTWSLSIPVP